MSGFVQGTRGLSLNTATIGWQIPLERTVALCEEFGFGGIAPWRHELHDQGIAEVASRLKQSSLQVTGLCRGGAFTAFGEDGLQRAVDENKRAVDEAAEIGAKCLVLVVGGLLDGSNDITRARDCVRRALEAVLEYACDVGVPLAIEPLHPVYAAERSCISTLREALDLCDHLGEGVGVAIDVYHVWWDPGLFAQIQRAGDRILAFHVCDWLIPTRDPLKDRGMMGDGVIDLPSIRKMVETSGYDGMCEVEIFSENDWWQREPAEVLRSCIETYGRHVMALEEVTYP